MIYKCFYPALLENIKFEALFMQKANIIFRVSFKSMLQKKSQRNYLFGNILVEIWSTFDNIFVFNYYVKKDFKLSKNTNLIVHTGVMFIFKPYIKFKSTFYKIQGL